MARILEVPTDNTNEVIFFDDEIFSSPGWGIENVETGVIRAIPIMTMLERISSPDEFVRNAEQAARQLKADLVVQLQNAGSLDTIEDVSYLWTTLTQFVTTVRHARDTLITE